MKNLFYLFTLFLIFAITAQAESRPATKSQIKLTREAMQDFLKDADSAKFKNVRLGIGENKNIICGEVNAKNGFGGYSGFFTFMAMYVGPEDYQDSASVKRKASVLIIGVDSQPKGPSEVMCAEKGIN